jgi:hypothetical protein
VVGVSTAGRFAHRPGTVLTVAALAAATALAALAGPGSVAALAATAIGVVGLAVGLTRGDRRIAALGALALLAGVLAAGVAGSPPLLLLPATAVALLAWAFATGAFAAREELRGGTVERSEVLHVATATGTGALATGAAYGLYRTVTVGASVLGVTLLLVAAVTLGLALRDED